MDTTREAEVGIIKVMNKHMLEFLNSQRVGVLSVQMLDKTPHGATVHFAHTDNPIAFIFETYREYRKCEPLYAQKETPASFVVGFQEGQQSKTAQLDGIVSLIESGDSRVTLYLEKFPEKREKAKGDKVVWFVFTPTWWRFTDWSGPQGKSVYLSNDATRDTADV